MSDLIFQCPKCMTSLIENASVNSIECTACKSSWLKREGVYQFGSDLYWGEVPEQNMRSYLDTIPKKGIEQATQDLIHELDNNIDLYRFFFDSSRADWRFGTEIKSTDRVLDVGCGMGGNTFALCDIAKEIVSFDLSWMRAKFVQLRAQHEGKTNIQVFSADFINLPLKEEQFDVVIFNGILEWIGQDMKFADPYDVQVWVMQKVFRLLKPGGRFYIGIENRWAISYLTGTPDHVGLRWTSWMPRFLARPYTKLRLGIDYRTYTHSQPGYIRLLQKGGFTNIRTMMPFPGYNDQRILIPFENTACLAYTMDHLMGNLNWKKRIVKKLARIPGILWLYRYFFFSYNLYAVKHDITYDSAA